MKSNEKRKEEIKDATVKAEADKVAARAIALEKKLAGPKNVVLDEKNSIRMHVTSLKKLVPSSNW